MAMEEMELPGTKPRMDRSRYATVAILVAVGGLLVLQGVGEARRATLVKAGEMAPPVSGTTLEGDSFDLAALRGQAVVVGFWATWCKACKREMPTLLALASEYRERGLAMVAANNISQDEPAAVGATMARLAPDRPENVHVVLASDQTLAAYRVQMLPTTYLLSREGRVVRAFGGLTSESDLRDAVERALQP